MRERTDCFLAATLAWHVAYQSEPIKDKAQPRRLHVCSVLPVELRRPLLHACPTWSFIAACQTLRVAGQRRWRRWLWRIALGVAILVVVGTVFSLGYNAVTRKPMAVPTGLTYVRTGDLRTRFRQLGYVGHPDRARPRFP